MTFWQLIDSRLDKLRPRTVAGAGIFALTVLIFAMLWARPELADDDLFKTLSQAVVVQGLVGLAMAFWFTAKERDVDEVEVVNDRDHPVQVEEE